jgi:hypothetical protein
MAGLMLKKEKKTESWSWIKRSVETPISLSMAARSLSGPTSGRPYRRASLEEVSSQQCSVSEDTQQGLGRYVK